ncbi:MAG TPA: sugar ABC transporter permease [Vitreimonas sp.]|nr:sugar ABC transporter permease [Vitreimonas sp.]
MIARPIRRPRERLLVAGLLAPALLLLFVFVLLPALWAVAISLTNQALTGVDARSPRFIGLDNYERLLADRTFFASLARSGTFVFASAIVGQSLLGFVAAFLLAGKHIRGRGVFSAAILLPLVVPETVAALAWASMTAPSELGTLNRIVGVAGVGPVRWLQEYPMASIIVINTWRGIAFAMVLFAAALESVPRELLEAAEVDGASGRQQLRYVTLPLIKYAVLLFLLLTTITTFGVFGLVYFLTRGGPGGETTLLTVYIYEHSFRFFELGFGSAAAVVMLAIVLALGLFYVRLLKARI